MFDVLAPEEAAALRGLEEALWREDTRFDPQWMRSVLADDFVEYGRSGRTYRLAEALAVARQPIEATLPLPAFQARLLGPGVVQVTYESAVVYAGRVEHARRSSLWTRGPAGWRLCFHQGTPFDGGPESSVEAPASPRRTESQVPVASIGDACIVPTEESHLAEVHHVLDTVAREGRYLAFTQAPPKEQSLAFYRSLLQAESPYFVALVGGAVVGWCDVSRLGGQSRAHIGVLGMGLLPRFRQRGLGRRLLQAAIERSWACGLSRLELTVRDDNPVAKALYEKLGFQVEGLRRRGSVVGDEVRDVWMMSLLKA